jgi:hypothetical protein
MSNYDLETQLAELRSRVASTQLLLRLLTAGLVLAVAGIVLLLFFPEWVPGRLHSGKPQSPGALKNDVSLDLLKDVRDLREYLSRDLDDMKKDLKKVADSNLKIQADGVALRTQLDFLNRDLRKDMINMNIDLKKDLSKVLANEQSKPAEKKK